MSSFCSNILSPRGLGVVNDVRDQFSNFVNLSNQFVRAAARSDHSLRNFRVTPISTGASYNFNDIVFTPFEHPEDPAELTRPGRQLGDAPTPPTLTDIEFNAPAKPSTTLPADPTVMIPSPPTLGLIPEPGSPPTLSQVAIPDYISQPLPEVPTLEQLSLPTAPDVNLEQFSLERPDFQNPLPYLYDNDYIRNANEARAAIFDTVDDSFYAAEAEFNLRNAEGAKTNQRLGAMLDGGTGLPAPVEQALFDRAINREEVSSEQAVAQASQEWAARGFTLPGSTLLARVSEARQNNRTARAQLNREILIQVHTQEIENLRFSVQQGIALQGQMFDQYIRLHDAGRQMADRAFDVARAIFDARLEVFRTELQIYQADIAAFAEKVKIELAKLEVFRSQLEAQRILGEINEQEVRLYEAQLRGVLAGVEVFKAEVEGANAQIRAQTNQLEQFKITVDAYVARLQGERTKFDIFDTTVRAEESKVRVFEAQVSAYAQQIAAYRAEVEAEAARTNAIGSLNENRTRAYAAEAQGWSSVANYDIANLNAEVEVLRANVQKYTGLLGAEEARVRGEARNAEIQFQQNQAQITASIKAVDQAIAQLQLASTLGLEATKTTAQVNAQLAASAMSGISVSAGISESSSRSASRNASCSVSGPI